MLDYVHLKAYINANTQLSKHFRMMLVLHFLWSPDIHSCVGPNDLITTSILYFLFNAHLQHPAHFFRLIDLTTLSKKYKL